MKKIGIKKINQTFKWAFISPFLMLGLWIIGLFLPDFRKRFINIIKRILEIMLREAERSI